MATREEYLNNLKNQMQAQEDAYFKDMFKDRPNYDNYSVTDASGNLKDQYKLSSQKYQDMLSGVKLDNTGYDAYKKQATWDPTTQGDSPWVKLMKEQAAIQQAQRADDLAASSAGAQAQARSALAMRGGLAGGARERLAAQGQRDLLRGQQGLARQAMSDIANINVQDQSQRMNMLGNLSNLDINRFQANLGQQKDLAEMGLKTDQYNLTNVLGDMKNRQANDMEAWKQMMEVRMAERNATATEKASEGSCWLITRLAKEMKLPADESKLLTQFKHWVLGTHQDLAKFYIRKCEPLISLMSDKQFDWSGFGYFNHALVSMLRGGEIEGAFGFFKNTLAQLLETYWPECPEPEAKQLIAEMHEKQSYMAQVKCPELSEGDKSLGEVCLRNLTQDQFAEEK